MSNDDQVMSDAAGGGGGEGNWGGVMPPAVGTTQAVLPLPRMSNTVASLPLCGRSRACLATKVQPGAGGRAPPPPAAGFWVSLATAAGCHRSCNTN